MISLKHSCVVEASNKGTAVAPFSFFLFSLTINKLANEIVLKGERGITLSPDILQILIMFFADDVVLLSNTIVGFQQQLSVLRDTAKRSHLVVSFEKSQVVFFFFF